MAKKEAIIVKGREISYEIKDVDIYSLEYYKENPRINYIVSKHSPEKVTQQFIEQELLKLDTVKERIKDLEENKGLLDEVYVLGNKVVEGNTRLCAFRRLHKKYPDDSRWRVIKARILQNDVTDDELFYILSIFHIKGKTEWDAYEKAAYIYKMIKVLNKSPEDIGKQLGKQRKTVEAMLRAYEVMSRKYLATISETDLVNGVRDQLKKYSYFEAFFCKRTWYKGLKRPLLFWMNLLIGLKKIDSKGHKKLGNFRKFWVIKKHAKPFMRLMLGRHLMMQYTFFMNISQRRWIDFIKRLESLEI